MLTRIIAAVAAALVLALGATGWLLKAQIEKTAAVVAAKQQAEGALTSSQGALKRAEAALARLRLENAATARETASLRRSLESALAENRAWSESALPKSVQEVFNARPPPSGDPSGGAADGLVRSGNPADNDPATAAGPTGALPGAGDPGYHEW